MPNLFEVAKETLDIVEAGGYTAPSGRHVEIGALARAAREGTRLLTPQWLRERMETRTAPAASEVPVPVSPLRVEVTGETTGAACQRLVAEGESPMALNFASAVEPGGGFLRQAKAQEEDLCRASALYPCLLTQPAYYDANRASGSGLYTDHMIHSPAVPFFRDEPLELLETPFAVSILTAPAPYAPLVLRDEPDARMLLRTTLARRARYVLLVAAEMGHRCLVLGAWGCGAFRNDPADAVDAFDGALREPGLRGSLSRVVFGVYESAPGQPNRRAFQARFATL